MKKRSTKILSLVLSLVMVFSLLPMSVFAEMADTESAAPAQEETVGITAATDAAVNGGRGFGGKPINPRPMPQYPAQTLTSEEIDGLTVTVDAPKGALPMGVEMNVTKIENMDSVQAAVDNLMLLKSTALVAADITFIHNGKEIQPKKDVTVTMTSPELEGKDDLTVVHLDASAQELENGDEVVSEPVSDVTADQVNSVTFNAAKFSTFTVVWSGAASATEANRTVLNFTGVRSGYEGSVSVYYLDQNGNYLPRPSSVEASYTYNLSNTSASSPITVNMSDLAKDIEGYEYLGALCTNDGSTSLEMTHLNAYRQRGTGSSYYYPVGVFMNGTTQQRSIWLDNGAYRMILLVYSGETVVPENTVTVHYGYVTQSGAFEEFPEGSSTSTSYPTSLSTADYNSSTKPYAFLEYDFKGYTYKETHLGSVAGTSIRPVLRMSQGFPEYTTSTSPNSDNSWPDLANGQDIYVIYEKTQYTTGVGGDSGSGETPEVPAPDPLPASKKVHDNGDGTFDITLSVTGQKGETEEISRASVIVVFDISNSMRYDLAQSSGNSNERLNTAKSAVQELASTLLGITDEKTGEHLVEMALIRFGTNATAETFGTDEDGKPIYFTTNYNTGNNSYYSKVNALTYPGDDDGATNWEAALRLADALQCSTTSPTYVIFVTDGEPTYRVSRGNDTDEDLYGDTQLVSLTDGGTRFSWDESLTNKSYFGTGTRTVESHRQTAVNAGIDIREHNKQFFGIGLSFEAAKVEDLVAGIYEGVDLPEDEIAHYYPATKPGDIKDAFGKIANAVREGIGYNEVALKDDVTELSTVEISLVGGATNFVCRKGPDSNPANNPVWNDAPAPTVDAQNHVQWSPVATGELEEGTTYSITFTVWPSQEAYDIIADINNSIVRDADGTVHKYDSPTAAFNAMKAADPSLAKQIALNASTGNYTLKTNTDFNLTYTYNGIEYTQPESQHMENGDMLLPTNFFRVTKEWSNLLPQDSRTALMLTDSNGYLVHKDGSYIHDNGGNTVGYWETDKIDPEGVTGVKPVYYIDLIVTKGDEDYMEIRLTSEDTTPWTWDQMFIAPGSLNTAVENGVTTIQVRETGDDYTVKEKPSDAYYWELHAVTYHPMVINGTAAMLEKVTENIPEMDDNTVNGDYYKFGGVVYKKLGNATDASMTATNLRRSYLNLTKTVTGTENSGYDANAFFKYTVKMNYADGKHPGDEDYNAYDDGFWFSAYDPTIPQVDENNDPVLDEQGNQKFGGTVMDLEVTGATAEVKNGKNTGYWYFDNDGTVTFKIKAGWNVRFTNLFAGTTYEITESDMADGYTYDSLAATAVLNGASQTYAPTIDNDAYKINGSILAANTNYTVTYTNSFEGVFYVYHSSNNTVERFPMAVDGVKVTSFDIAHLTLDGSLYGGYYTDYAGKSADFDATALTYTDGKATDEGEGAKPYTGNSDIVWSGAITANGLEMQPETNTVYYLKEVPAAKYLRPYLHFTYKVGWSGEMNGTDVICTAWLISDIDDLNYQETGFVIIDTATGAEGAVKSLTVQNTNSDNTIKLTPKRVFKAYADNYLTYLTVINRAKTDGTTYNGDPVVNLLKDGDEVLQYWVTPDGLMVTGTAKRTYSGLISKGVTKTETAVDSVITVFEGN